MTGIRFYEKFKDEEKLESAGKVIAVFIHKWRDGSEEQGRLFDAVVGIGNLPNPPALLSTVAERHLQTKCRRISEARARRLNPNIFRLLKRR